MSDHWPWHVSKADGTTKEETAESIRRGIKEGLITRETLVWSPGMADWTPAGQVEGLFAPPPQTHTTRRLLESNNQPPPLPGPADCLVGVDQPDKASGFASVAAGTEAPQLIIS